MFKKREKTQNQLKRGLEDRHQDEKDDVDESEQSHLKRPKTHDHGRGCDHHHKPNSSVAEAGLKASTRDHRHYKEDYIREEVSELAAFKADNGNHKEVSKRRRENATAHLEIDTAYDNDAMAHAKKNIEISKGIKEGKLDPNVYRGMHGYQNYFEQTEEDLRHKKFSGTLGPVRAPTFIRNTTRVDYNPERCKDWYETGRCNFGDSCVFIHDRSDYKSGWQLDQEYEADQKRKQLKLMGHEVDEDEENYEIHSQEGDDGLPVVCRICEQMFSGPIVTQCGHYFCERCALSHYSTSSTCFQCGKATNGIFNEAPAKIIANLKDMLKKQAQSNEADEAHQSDDDDATTKAGQTINKSDQNGNSSSDDSGGVLTKKDKLVLQEYRDKAKEIEKKKYHSQTGWFIP